MEGFKMAGKVFCVVEELNQFANQHKGMKVAEFLKLRRQEKVEEAEARQFGMPLTEYRRCMRKWGK